MEWWRATDEALQHGDGLAVRELSGAIHAAQGRVVGQRLVGGPWCRADNGPVANALLRLDRCGWSVKLTGILIDHRGQELHLGRGSPALLEAMVVERLRDQELAEVCERKLKDYAVGPAQEILDQGIWVDPARRASKAKRFRGRGRTIIQHLFTDSYVDGVRLHSWGYRVARSARSAGSWTRCGTESGCARTGTRPGPA